MTDLAQKKKHIAAANERVNRASSALTVAWQATAPADYYEAVGKALGYLWAAADELEIAHDPSLN